jgi:hypothetical protein
MYGGFGMTIGYITDADDMLHDIEEMDRKNKGILTDVKRFGIIRAANRMGIKVTDEEGVQRLSRMYALSVENIKRAFIEPLPSGSIQDHAMARFSAVVLNNIDEPL